MPNNEGYEYDVTDEQGNTDTHTAESADTAAAIQSLLDMQANQSGSPKPKVTVQQSSSMDLSQLSDHLNQQQFYTIEQAMTDKDQVSSCIQSENQNISKTENDEDEILTAVPLSVSSNSGIREDVGSETGKPGSVFRANTTFLQI
jgi:hypothetical protein